MRDAIAKRMTLSCRACEQVFSLHCIVSAYIQGKLAH